MNQFWQRWLVGVSLILIIGGVLMAFLAQFATLEPLDIPFWEHESDITDAMRDYQGFSTGLLGALMASWGVMMLAISWIPFKKGELWAWNTLAAATAMWFVIDEGFSLYYGVYFNALGNLVLLVLLVIPLAATYRSFHA
jgi:hypothetical protein